MNTQLSNLMQQTGLSESELMSRLRDIMKTSPSEPKQRKERDKNYTPPKEYLYLEKVISCSFCKTERPFLYKLEKGQVTTYLTDDFNVKYVEATKDNIGQTIRVKTHTQACTSCLEKLQSMSKEELVELTYNMLKGGWKV